MKCLLQKHVCDNGRGKYIWQLTQNPAGSKQDKRSRTNRVRKVSKDGRRMVDGAVGKQLLQA